MKNVSEQVATQFVNQLYIRADALFRAQVETLSLHRVRDRVQVQINGQAWNGVHWELESRTSARSILNRPL